MERRNQELTEEFLLEENIMVLNIIKNIKYCYMEELDNIEFISRYAISTM
jgi:hypothetical protein